MAAWIGFIIRLIAYAIVLKIIDRLVSGFRIEGFGAAIWMAVIMSVLTGIGEFLYTIYETPWDLT